MARMESGGGDLAPAANRHETVVAAATSRKPCITGMFSRVTERLGACDRVKEP